MFSKSLLVLLFILPFILSSTTTQGDSTLWNKYAFDSIYKVTLSLNEIVTVQFQHQISAPPATFDVSLIYTVDGLTKQTLQCTVNPCKVTFAAASVAAGGDYQVKIVYSTPLAWAGSSNPNGNVRVGALTITGSVGKILLKQLAAIGQYRYHRIFLNSVTSYTVYLRVSNGNHNTYLIAANSARLVKLAPQNTLTSNYAVNTAIKPSSGIGAASAIDANLIQYTFTWATAITGYFWLVIDNSEQNSPSMTLPNQYLQNWSLVSSFNTEIYICPYEAAFPDVKGIFAGCVFQSQATKLPCIKSNPTTQRCIQCYNGYKLVDGFCKQQLCPAGQYKRYGNCYPNPTGCLQFNNFTQCAKCADTYKLNNGVCQRIPLNCANRTYYNANLYICSAVSDKCDKYDSLNGKCTTCKDQAFKVVDGACVDNSDNCGLKQYLKDGNCVDIDPLCQTFQRIGGKCKSCVFAYQFNDKKTACVLIKCPDRYVPNDYGKCVKVSDLCLKYDNKGKCFQCIDSHIPDQSGICLQIIAPTPCPARQYLGFDNVCHEVSEFCDIYNQVGGFCTKCVNGYYLMYTGLCVKQTQCKNRQFLINNDCHDVSPTCGNYDRNTGKCLNCVSESYQLYYGLCIPVTTCGARQWTDDNGKCHEVNTRCNTFHPSTGDCTSCNQGFTYFNGVCCVNGQLLVNGVCQVASDASKLQNKNGCRIQIEGIGCVRCDKSFTLTEDDQGFTYCKAK